VDSTARADRAPPRPVCCPTRCEPGRPAARGLRTATGPRSQHIGFRHELPRFAARRSLPHALRAGTARGPRTSDRGRSPVAALWIHARAPEVRCTPLVAPCAAGRDGPRSAGFGPRPASHSGFTDEFQWFATCHGFSLGLSFVPFGNQNWTKTAGKMQPRWSSSWLRHLSRVAPPAYVPLRRDKSSQPRTGRWNLVGIGPRNF